MAFELPDLLTQPWEHQKDAFHWMADRDYGELAIEMGAGKTLVVVMLRDAWKSRATLIVCPKHVIPVWQREFERHSPNPPTIVLLNHATAAQKLIAAKRGWFRITTVPTVFVVNYDSVWRGELGNWLKGCNWDLAVCDESHRIKGHKSKVSTFMADLSYMARRRLCLTGTPLYHSQLDIYGQARFLDWEIFGTSYHRFFLHYARTFDLPITTKRGHKITTKVVCGFKNQRELEQRMKAFVFYPRYVDKTEWPEFRDEIFTCTLPENAKAIYSALKKDFMAEVENGTILALNGLKATMRLRQLVAGHLRADDSAVVETIHTAKADLLREVLEDIDSPVVVFAEFRHDFAEIRRVVESMKRRYGEISGRASDIGEGGTYPENVDVLGVQYQAGGSGLDFQNRSHRAIYYTPTWRRGDYEQSRRRLYRAGQKHPVVFTHLVCERTVEVAVTHALEKKGEIIDAVIEAIRAEG